MLGPTPASDTKAFLSLAREKVVKRIRNATLEADRKEDKKYARGRRNERKKKHHKLYNRDSNTISFAQDAVGAPLSFELHDIGALSKTQIKTRLSL